jgi:hypothetical protein
LDRFIAVETLNIFEGLTQFDVQYFEGPESHGVFRARVFEEARSLSSTNRIVTS